MGSGFTYEGRLTDSLGNPANGSYDFTFKLFDSSIGGVQIGSTVTLTNQTVTGGIFDITLNFGSSHAQRDLIDLTLIEAARRAGETSLVRALANERLALKPKSPLARRYRDQGTKQAA